MTFSTCIGGSIHWIIEAAENVRHPTDIIKSCLKITLSHVKNMKHNTSWNLHVNLYNVQQNIYVYWVILFISATYNKFYNTIFSTRNLFKIHVYLFMFLTFHHQTDYSALHITIIKILNS